MTGLPRLDLVHKAIAAGGWGNIEWKPSAEALFLKNPRRQGLTPHGVRLQLHEFVLEGNVLSFRAETRLEKLEEQEGCADHPYWYKAVLPTPEFPKGLIVEVLLLDPEEEDELVVQF